MKTQKTLSLIYGMTAVTAMWYLAGLLLGFRLIPAPHTVFTVFWKLTISGQLLLHGAASLLRLGAGIVLALLLGVPIGILTGISRKMDRYISPVVYILYPLPKIAFLPVFMLLFGLGDLSKILLLLSVILFQIILAARDGVKEIPRELHIASRTLRMSQGDLFFRLYLPSALPRLFSALRISVGIGIAVLFFAENYATTYGLGYFVMNSWVMINYPLMFAGIMALGISAALVLAMLDRIQRIICPWLDAGDKET
jgi:ABC-type nitrate/sulfonate/bicarbonate transport system permease component